MKSLPINLWFFPDLRRFNPYQDLLYENLVANRKPGIPRPNQVIANVPNVFHLHWEHFVYRGSRTPVEAGKRIMYFLEHLIRLKQGGWSIYWTIHNLEPHENRFPEVHAVLQNRLVDHCDQIFCHSEGGIKVISDRLPHAAYKLSVVHHPKFRPYYEKLRQPCELGFEQKFEGYFKFLFFGEIREYKGLDLLLHAFIRANPLRQNMALIVAGDGQLEKALNQDDSLPHQVRDQIFFINRRIRDEEIDHLLRGVDALVLPYKKVLTSGGYILGRDYHLPLVFPREFLALQDECEIAEVHAFEANNSSDLSNVLSSLPSIEKSSKSLNTVRSDEENTKRISLLQSFQLEVIYRKRKVIPKRPAVKKTLICILHYERDDLTNQLYKSLREGLDDTQMLIVIDNGSANAITLPGIRVSKNVFFGGALNVAFKLIQQSSEFDSLLFLNNDLIVNGKVFVKSLKRELKGDFKIVSPSIIQPGSKQCFWPNMWNWGHRDIREVPWVDFMAPLIHRDLIEEIGQYSSLLELGWGNDIFSGIVCKNKGWKIGVTDNVTAVHLGSETIKSHGPSNYRIKAEDNMVSFFHGEALFEEFLALRTQNLKCEDY